LVSTSILAWTVGSILPEDTGGGAAGGLEFAATGKGNGAAEDVEATGAGKGVGAAIPADVTGDAVFGETTGAGMLGTRVGLAAGAAGKVFACAGGTFENDAAGVGEEAAATDAGDAGGTILVGGEGTGAGA
jgi:hypothetical protein